ncbi:undecaprenyl-diphosphatase [Sulfurospirillum sp. 1612]|uniref:undecaprenyl-diphosphatase n=1 Tax=Sulfurospirillum sp. 1612 TaxID=3094835 RepID=UPI002F93BD07
MEHFNILWYQDINTYAGVYPWIDFLMQSVATVTPYLFIVMLFYLWFSKRKNLALFAGYAAILGVLINQIIGLFYFHPRPFMENLGHVLLSHSADSSFPSDHVSFTVSIALTLTAFKTTRTLGIIAFILGLFCGVARIYCGVHWPFDIIGAVMVAGLASFLVLRYQTQWSELNHVIITMYHKIIKKEFLAK